jgi:hypothetical protein
VYGNTQANQNGTNSVSAGNIFKEVHDARGKE